MGRVICGGEDEEFADESRRDEMLLKKSNRISEKLKVLFPQLDTRPEFAWAGSFGTTATGLPYIGALARHPRIFAVQGYGGNGITFSQNSVGAYLCCNCGRRGYRSKIVCVRPLERSAEGR